MTLQSTKPHLIKILRDKENKVIALTGRWGTGKSYLWREVKKDSPEDAIKKSLYISLFGVSDMIQLKIKILQSSVPNAGDGRATWQRIDAAIGSVKKLATAFHKGFSALDDIALLAVPSILKNRVLVIDDIERKHDKLSIDEVLGFIDEFTQLYGARIVIILNSDQLSDKNMWEKLREKVIDQEIRLDTSPSEAFEIAASLTPTNYQKQLKQAVETCKVTNIRVIRKIIRAINRILEGREQLPDAVLGRIVPSTVLLAAIHYKGIEDGPDFEFVLRTGSPKSLEELGHKPSEETHPEQHRMKWKQLLNQLGINSSDEYELLVVDYLETGLPDSHAVDLLIDRYVAETDAMETQRRLSQFREHLIWHHNMPYQELLNEAQELVNVASKIDPYTVTWLDESLRDIPGGEAIGNQMVDSWLTAFKVRGDQAPKGRDFFGRKLHPRIQTEFDAQTDDAQTRSTLYEICERIARDRSWGTREKLTMGGTTVQDFERSIKTVDIDKFKLIMLVLIDMRANPALYESDFGSALERFVEACRNICADPNSERLAKLIRIIFNEAKLTSILSPTSANQLSTSR
jgi:hypothetical protein